MKAFSESIRIETPGIYQISVQGTLDPGWSDRLGGMEIMTLRSPDDDSFITILTGELVDQADLLGILNFLYDTGFPILSVKRLDYVARQQ